MKTLKQTMIFNTGSDELYDILINPRKLGKVTGGKTTNTQKEGGKFSNYDDYIQGTNVTLVPGKKIVQKWTCADFPFNHFTEVTIELKKKGDKQTELVLEQKNIPDEFYEDMTLGWDEFYWEPIKDYLEDLMWK
ncbi:MAG: SRPBCC domain-containing protein [Candidatus Pacearchaeota archaeon]|jgi:activator of HSP90 ATPase